MNLSILALGLAVMGVSIGEGLLVSSFLRSAARQPELYNKLQTSMLMGIAFIEGTFFVLLAVAFIL
ncbi:MULTISPECIES: F0F1 ATP synthase subunit C [unclassified Streptococcus]|uniref:F0F1 ATP synthase subunit C n=1 Tax=unclassified Streptococcus TaxID=2608887 RepID=UPI001071BD66|nr:MULTISPECIES: F0F1 ATP synthase subunit C [unclassified Streptococcus]MBF0805449.1 F0F1 ATP synthase subunit C [Streptococcus sp. 19428wA2_WM07]TFU29064.1 F0F1 ATP synthase subunit C [Streptococcus sp. WM07]